MGPRSPSARSNSKPRQRVPHPRGIGPCAPLRQGQTARIPSLRAINAPAPCPPARPPGGRNTPHPQGRSAASGPRRAPGAGIPRRGDSRGPVPRPFTTPQQLLAEPAAMRAAACPPARPLPPPARGPIIWPPARRPVQVKFAIPKGSLEEATLRLLERSWTRVTRKSRTYRVFLDDPSIVVKMLRPQEIPTLVAEGMYDVGITGRDWVAEAKADVEPLLDLEYGRIKLVVAFPDRYRYRSMDAMVADYAKRGRTLRISSEYLTTASAFIAALPSYRGAYGAKRPLILTPWLRTGSNRAVQIHLSFGATEAKPPDDVDAIIDVTETGTTLRQNKLRIADTVTESTAHLVANRLSLRDPAKRGKLFDIVTLMRGAVQGQKYLHLYLNVAEGNLEGLLRDMPSLKRPTVSRLAGREGGWYGVNTVILKSDYHKLIPRLRRTAQGLVVHEPRQILELEEVKRDEER